MAQDVTLPTRYGTLPQTHKVPDVLAPDLSVVFCGTALGFESARSKAYYAHPGNMFWKTLYKTGLIATPLKPADYRQVLESGIGLTDLCKDAYGVDSQLPSNALNAHALKEKMRHYAPRILAFTSKTAAAAFLEKPTRTLQYGFQPETYHTIQLMVLPSPSGQARSFWNEGIWQELADAVKNLKRT